MPNRSFPALKHVFSAVGINRFMHYSVHDVILTTRRDEMKL